MYYSREPIDLQRAIALAPSIAAQHPHSSRPDGHALIPTARVLEGLIGEGFQIHGVLQTHSLLQEAVPLKHLLRLHKQSLTQKAEEPEVVLIGSPNNSRRYQLMAGVIRYACTNGLITGELWGSVEVEHSDNVVSDVIESAYKVVAQFDDIDRAVDKMRGIYLHRDEQARFVTAALTRLRSNHEDRVPPLNADQVLHPRRLSDAGDDLWSTFNRVQENLTKGALLDRRRDASDRIQRRRPPALFDVDINVKLNRALWTLAEEMAEPKSKVEHKVERKVKSKALEYSD